MESSLSDAFRLCASMSTHGVAAVAVATAAACRVLRAGAVVLLREPHTVLRAPKSLAARSIRLLWLPPPAIPPSQQSPIGETHRAPPNAAEIRAALATAERSPDDPVAQATLYNALLNGGYASDVVTRFETLASTRIRSNPDCIAAYLAAAHAVSPHTARRAVDLLRDALAHKDNPQQSSYAAYQQQQQQPHQQQQQQQKARRSILLDPREFKLLFTNSSNDPTAMNHSTQNSSKQPSSYYNQHQVQPPQQQQQPVSIFGSGNNPFSPPQSSNPRDHNGANGGGASLNVTLTEVYTWQRYLLTLLSRLLFIGAVLVAVSILADQPGMLKTGITGLDIQPDNEKQKIHFNDVQGCDEAKAELEEIVDFLKNPHKFLEIGGKLPRGILLYGPPGTGKTHLARAVAGEANVPFFQMSGSEFDELYVGVGARRVRDLFAAARKSAPCIIFVDEIDAVGSKRNSRDQSHMRQTLNQLLTELDGFHPEEGIVFIGATNTPEVLDKALTRPGRMDKLVPVPLPDVTGRTKILQVHLRKVRALKSVDASVIARGTPGLSGADLANVVNQAAVRATRMRAPGVRMEDLEWAKDKIQMGAERRSAVISAADKRRTAIHEGGHTIAALYTPGATPLHKVTVMPRGNALGLTHFLPEADQHSKTKEQLDAQLVVAMGGLAAEELIYGKTGVTTGPAGDLKSARSTALGMILSAGMSEKVGFAGLGDDLDSLSPDTRAQVELEVKSKLDCALKIARDLLKNKRKELELLTNALVTHETLDADEVRRVIKGEAIESISDKLRHARSQIDHDDDDGNDVRSIAAAAAAAAVATGRRSNTKGGGDGGHGNGGDGGSGGGGGNGNSGGNGGSRIPATIVIEVPSPWAAFPPPPWIQTPPKPPSSSQSSSPANPPNPPSQYSVDGSSYRNVNMVDHVEHSVDSGRDVPKH